MELERKLEYIAKIMQFISKLDASGNPMVTSLKVASYLGDLVDEIYDAGMAESLYTKSEDQ